MPAHVSTEKPGRTQEPPIVPPPLEARVRRERESAPTWSVMVVDDDDSAREHFADLLTVEGFAVSTSINGARALERLRVLPGRCLILLDLNMPVMPGQEFLLRLAEIPKSTLKFP